MPLLFGIFQGIMPLFGFFTLFAGIIMKYSGIVIFAILAVIGGNMMKESLSKREGSDRKQDPDDDSFDLFKL